MIQNGDRVKDQVTGFTGIAVAVTTWLNGCRRITVQPEKLVGGKMIETQTLDEPQLTLVKRAAITCGARETGGPIPAPRQQPPVR